MKSGWIRVPAVGGGGPDEATEVDDGLACLDLGASHLDGTHGFQSSRRAEAERF
jgi:hypothetical protein